MTQRHIVLYDYKNLMLKFVIPFASLCKLFQFRFMPDKAFFSSKYLLNMIQTPVEYLKPLFEGDSFNTAILFFKVINVFGFKSILSWALFISVLFNLLVIFLIHKNFSLIDKLQMIYLYMSIAVLNIFIFNIGKDIIQFIIFLSIYFVLNNKNTSSFKKTILSLTILLFCGLFFRKYYIIIAIFTIIVGFLIYFFTKKRRVQRWIILKIFILNIGAVGLVLVCLSYVFPDIYYEIIAVRSKTLSHISAKSAIYEWWNSSNITNFMLNYITIFWRMLFPIELIFKGLGYLPFVVYQIIVSLYLFVGIKNVNLNTLEINLALCLFLGFVSGSVFFEPDFGSWIRHETAAFPIMIIIIRNTKISTIFKLMPKIAI